MQIKTALRFHLSQSERLRSLEQMTTFSHCWWENKIVWKAVWRILIKLKTDKSQDPPIPLVDVYTHTHTHREIETYYYRDTCSPKFITVLVIIARKWKCPICPSTTKWIMQSQYIYSVTCHSTVKKNEIFR